MSAPAATVEELLAAVLRLERKVDDLARARAAADVRLLSKREAARRLRVSRGSTLEELIAAGHLNPVPWRGGELRIPAAEVERLERDGLPAAGAPRGRAPKRRTAPPSPRAAGAAIAELDPDRV